MLTAAPTNTNQTPSSQASGHVDGPGHVPRCRASAATFALSSNGTLRSGLG